MKLNPTRNVRQELFYWLQLHFIVSHNTSCQIKYRHLQKHQSTMLLCGFQTALSHLYLRSQKDFAPESSAAGWWALQLNKLNWMLWEHEYGNGELKNGAIGNSHEEHIALKHCCAVSREQAQTCSAAARTSEWSCWARRRIRCKGEAKFQSGTIISLISDFLESRQKVLKCNTTCSRVLIVAGSH